MSSLENSRRHVLAAPRIERMIPTMMKEGLDGYIPDDRMPVLELHSLRVFFKDD